MRVDVEVVILEPRQWLLNFRLPFVLPSRLDQWPFCLMTVSDGWVVNCRYYLYCHRQTGLLLDLSFPLWSLPPTAVTVNQPFDAFLHDSTLIHRLRVISLWSPSPTAVAVQVIKVLHNCADTFKRRDETSKIADEQPLHVFQSYYLTKKRMTRSFKLVEIYRLGARIIKIK